MTYVNFNNRKPSEKISTCEGLVAALNQAAVFKGTLIFEGVDTPEGMIVGENASMFDDIFSITPMKEVENFQTLKVNLKGGRLGALTKAGLLHDIFSIALKLRELFTDEGCSVDMAVSTRSNNENLPGVYLYVLPKGMLYTNYIEYLAQKKESADTETQTQSRPAWSNRRQNRWGNR